MTAWLDGYKERYFTVWKDYYWKDRRYDRLQKKGRNIDYWWYAEDTVLKADTQENLQNLFDAAWTKHRIICLKIKRKILILTKDMLSSNGGICTYAKFYDLSEDDWYDPEIKRTQAAQNTFVEKDHLMNARISIKTRWKHWHRLRGLRLYMGKNIDNHPNASNGRKDRSHGIAMLGERLIKCLKE